MNRLRNLVGISMALLMSSPVHAFETTPFKGDIHAYGPVKDWTGRDVWIKAELGREHDVNSYGPLKDWTGADVWVKGEVGFKGETDCYGPVKDWTGREVWIK